MIFIDANVFLRHLVQPKTPQDQSMQNAASGLLREIELGIVDGITSEATVAEVLFILASKTHYQLDRPTVAGLLLPILTFPSLHIDRKAVCLEAIAAWEADSRLSFPDALALANGRVFGHSIATFDQHLARTAGALAHSWT